MSERFLIATVIFSLTTSAFARPAVAADEALETVGTLIAGHTYSTYNYISVTGESLTRGVFKPHQVAQMMDEVIRFTTPTIKSLEKLKKSDLTEEDKKYLAQVIDVYRHLEATAKRLQKAARSKRAGDLKRFDERRRETWDKLKELLGLEADQE